MTSHPSNTTTLTGPQELCRKCSYPVEDEVCPECGYNHHGQSEILERARSIGWIGRLLLVALALVMARILIENSTSNPVLALFIDSAGILDGTLKTSLAVIVLFIPGILAASACVRLTRGQWTLSRKNKVLLLIASTVFLLLPAIDLSFLIDRTFKNMGWKSLPFDWRMTIEEWSSALYLIGMCGGFTILFRSLGICSNEDPGGDDRWFLRHAWIGAVAFTVLYGGAILHARFNWAFKSLNGLDFKSGMRFEHAIGTVGTWDLRQFMAIIFMIYLLLFVRFVFRWRRALVGFAMETKDA